MLLAIHRVAAIIMFIFIVLVSCVFSNEKTTSFIGGQEVGNNLTNCAAYFYIPPALLTRMSRRLFFVGISK